MKLSQRIKDYLIANEGSRKDKSDRHILYKCPADKWTIGYGRNLTAKGISGEEALCLLENDILECTEDLVSLFPNFERFTNDRKIALIDVRFQHGKNGFRAYKRMIAAILRDDWNGAAFELLDSEYARKYVRRANDNADLLRNG